MYYIMNRLGGNKMYILKNSLVSIIRNKGRNILIGIIILVIAASSTVTLAIRNTANRLVKNYEESHDIIASISFDRKGISANFKGGEEAKQEFILTILIQMIQKICIRHLLIKS